MFHKSLHKFRYYAYKKERETKQNRDPVFYKQRESEMLLIIQFTTTDDDDDGATGAPQAGFNQLE